MNIYEIHEETGIALRKLHRLYAAGVLDCDPVDPVVSGIYTYLSRRTPLTVKQLLALIEEPKLLDDLAKHEIAAQLEIEELGNFASEAAPLEVVAHIHQAAYNDQLAISKIVPWLKSIIPADRAVRHHYVAIRLVMGSASPRMRQHHVALIRRALDYCRMHPEFNGWSKVVKRKSQPITWYEHPPARYDL